MTHGGKRHNAGRLTERQRQRRKITPGDKVRSVRMVTNDQEYGIIMALSPERRTLALILGVEIEQHIQRLGWQLIADRSPLMTILKEDEESRACASIRAHPEKQKRR